VNRLIKQDKTLEQWIKSMGTTTDLGSRYRGVVEVWKVNPLFYRPITSINRIEKTLEILTKKVVESFNELLIQEGVGPEFIRALALVADIIYNDTPSFRDPVTHAIDPFAYAFAHGGKDGIPFPVRYDVMKETIEFLEEAINNANLDGKLKRRALENLHSYWVSIQKVFESKENKE
jgi:hypothetical protein